MRIEQNKQVLKNGKYYKDYNFVFTHEDNSCMLHPASLKFLLEASKKGNFKYITLHRFRHTTYTCCPLITKWGKYQNV